MKAVVQYQLVYYISLMKKWLSVPVILLASGAFLLPAHAISESKSSKVWDPKADVEAVLKVPIVPVLEPACLPHEKKLLLPEGPVNDRTKTEILAGNAYYELLSKLPQTNCKKI